MYRLNVFAFDDISLLDDVRFKQYLDTLPLAVRSISIDAALKQRTLPAADVNLFLCSALTLDQVENLEKLYGILSAYAQGINLCLMQDDNTLNKDLVAHFHDFLLWPCTSAEFNARITRPLRLQQKPISDNNQLLEEFASLNLIGKSTQFLQNVQLIKKMSACHAAVLIQGETGTGKENAARAIHYLSKRREQSFVPVNCAAIPDELIESELFGHEKGAFTDAKQTQAGLVSLANQGTLFLDEVDSLTPKAQATLLRFLQTQEYRPLGAKQTMHADARILAATNADLKSLVANKQFREDLYFRLNVLNLIMPPLRERIDDISLIANSLLHRFSIEYQTAPKQLNPRGLDYLIQHHWPGNIRELENCLLRAFLLSPGAVLEFGFEAELHDADAPLSEQSLGFLRAGTEINTSDLTTDKTDTPFAATGISAQEEYVTRESLSRDSATSSSAPPLSFQDAKAIAINHFEENYLQHVMRIAKGNVSAAARIAGKERRALGKLLQKYAIDKSQFQTYKDIPTIHPQKQAPY